MSEVIKPAKTEEELQFGDFGKANIRKVEVDQSYLGVTAKMAAEAD